jgi:hypothetical protein
MVSALALNADKITLVVLALLWFALFILSRRLRWDERAYEQFKDSRIMWFWFDVFGVPKTRQNCLRFQFGVWHHHAYSSVSVHYRRPPFQ